MSGNNLGGCQEEKLQMKKKLDKEAERCSRPLLLLYYKVVCLASAAEAFLYYNGAVSSADGCSRKCLRRHLYSIKVDAARIASTLTELKCRDLGAQVGVKQLSRHKTSVRTGFIPRSAGLLSVAFVFPLLGKINRTGGERKNIPLIETAYYLGAGPITGREELHHESCYCYT